MNARKKELEAHRRFTTREIGEMLDKAAPPAGPVPEAKVVRGTFGKGPARAGAVAAENADFLAGSDVQVDVVEHFAHVALEGIALGKISDGEHGRRKA
jgi:hypothetical protein